MSTMGHSRIHKGANTLSCAADCYIRCALHLLPSSYCCPRRALSRPTLPDPFPNNVSQQQTSHLSTISTSSPFSIDHRSDGEEEENAFHCTTLVGVILQRPPPFHLLTPLHHYSAGSLRLSTHWRLTHTSRAAMAGPLLCWSCCWAHHSLPG